LLRNLVTFPIT